MRCVWVAHGSRAFRTLQRLFKSTGHHSSFPRIFFSMMMQLLFVYLENGRQLEPDVIACKGGKDEEARHGDGKCSHQSQPQDCCVDLQGAYKSMPLRLGA